MPTPDEELKDLMRLVGPRRVDTKEVEIEAHDPLKMQKLLERRKSKPIAFHTFPTSRVKRDGAETTCPNPDPYSE